MLIVPEASDPYAERRSQERRSRDHYTITNDVCRRDLAFGFTHNVGRLTLSNDTDRKGEVVQRGGILS